MEAAIKKIPYGMTDFESIIRDGYYYVDKTQYIEKVENISRFFFFVRPRRFGKSLFLNMQGLYYDINKKDKFEESFGELYIGKHPTPNRNKYLVLTLNFSSVASDMETLKQTFNTYCKLVMSAFAKDYSDLLGKNIAEELEKYRAMAFYTDGTKVAKRVDWDLSTVDFAVPGTYKIKGNVHQEHFEFPIAFYRADPCVAKWKNKYYFIATNDADDNHTLYIREADTIPELVNAEEKLILDSTTYPHVGNLLWAPEFHEINGKLYIFHAATPDEFFKEESHVMELREGGNPSCKEDWSEPKRVVCPDGSDLCEAGKEITLDMTCFEWEGDYYVIWSQRQFLPKDLGAWLYIAKLNPQEPWKLLTDPVVLLKPDYGWSNNHTFVVEGPFALPRENKLYVTFSGAAIDTSYVVGLLSIEKGKDLLQPENWKQGNYPILTARSVESEYGTGHNAYVTDEDGTVWNTYHARPGVEGVRSSGIRRVHFDIDGAPMLDVTEELDLSEAFAQVETCVVVR